MPNVFEMNGQVIEVWWTAYEKKLLEKEFWKVVEGRFKGKLNGAADLDHCFEEIHFDCVPRADAVFIRFDNQPEDMWAIDQIFVDTSYSLGPTDDYLLISLEKSSNHRMKYDEFLR
ncbi:hypothetical protein NECAME_07581 [Necator americanus]|uniref:Uncharacterized protein n=1 Tax=Necator americanus TaxID=51031 RepID=W2TPP9_NECAM|nr:hypothetical protein NECAME_07581 [Necator americanus]ETN83111.1 hypothetical protein NECAME_07581 [Necator americanus]